jgi:hypothetical protein
VGAERQRYRIRRACTGVREIWRECSASSGCAGKKSLTRAEQDVDWGVSRWEVTATKLSLVGRYPLTLLVAGLGKVSSPGINSRQIQGFSLGLGIRSKTPLAYASHSAARTLVSSNQHNRHCFYCAVTSCLIEKPQP